MKMKLDKGEGKRKKQKKDLKINEKKLRKEGF